MPGRTLLPGRHSPVVRWQPRLAAGAPECQAVPTEAEIIQGIQAPGRYDATVGSEDEARRVLRQAMPDALECPQRSQDSPTQVRRPGARSGTSAIPLSRQRVTTVPTSST